MQRTDFGGAQCSVARTLDVVGDPWTPLVLRDLALGISRFDAVQRNLGISRKVLAQRLQSLTDHGVVTRTAYQDNPPRYDYNLTEQGRDLALVLLALQAYGDRWLLGKGNEPIVWAHLTCGATSSPEMCCSACGEAYQAGELLPLKGPGFAADTYPEVAALLEGLAAGLG